LGVTGGGGDPQRWEIFPRLRTTKISETVVSVTNWRGWFGKFRKDSEERRMQTLESASGSESTDGASQAAAAEKKKGRKKPAASSTESDGADSSDSQSGQSSEYPPFFVENPKHDWLPVGDWLKKAAFTFDQNDNKLLAYPQGAYLKRVEQECAMRIEAINRARIKK